MHAVDGELGSRPRSDVADDRAARNPIVLAIVALVHVRRTVAVEISDDQTVGVVTEDLLANDETTGAIGVRDPLTAITVGACRANLRVAVTVEVHHITVDIPSNHDG